MKGSGNLFTCFVFISEGLADDTKIILILLIPHFKNQSNRQFKFYREEQYGQGIEDTRQAYCLKEREVGETFNRLSGILIYFFYFLLLGHFGFLKASKIIKWFFDNFSTIQIDKEKGKFRQSPY